MGRYARNIVINSEPSFVAGEKEKIRTARSENDAIIKDLHASLHLKESADFLRTIDLNRGPYNAALDEAIALATKGQREEASALLIGEVRRLQSAVFTAVEGAFVSEREEAEALAQRSREGATFGVLLMSGLAFLMALVGIAVGWAVTRNLRRALGAEPQELTNTVAKVASGDLTSVLLPRSGDTSSVMYNLARMQASLIDVVATVRENADSVASASAEIAQGNNDLSSRTEQQAAGLEETSASMEQMGSTAQQNADNSRQANQLATSASGVAAQGGRVVSEVVQTMKEINESSEKINQIIGVIDSIAFQTNILALNAAVEAARAGEQGRGFAVVAGEVRTLAKRSAEAAKEIKELIGSSVARVARGSALVDQAGVTMQEIVQSIQRVSDLMGEISSASDEQNSGVNQVAEAVSSMDQATQQNAALVEQSAAAAMSLQTQAEQLVKVVGAFILPSRKVSASDEPLHARPAKDLPHAIRTKSLPQVRQSVSITPALAGASNGGDWDRF
ncbi:methyl-accepting chemotaxis protein [Achromobacter mucicolens]|uniref:methyl-accepting chemotaxis protein n=1 Tax=Achromobacter mucicolens TaxID=1389922 RepID=UPI0015841007|nr:methyl-accepting chemotaxis protein [Achromobacter mucicolens]